MMQVRSGTRTKRKPQKGISIFVLPMLEKQKNDVGRCVLNTRSFAIFIEIGRTLKNWYLNSHIYLPFFDDPLNGSGNENY
jgi:hypothetical protein